MSRVPIRIGCRQSLTLSYSDVVYKASRSPSGGSVNSFSVFVAAMEEYVEFFLIIQSTARIDGARLSS